MATSGTGVLPRGPRATVLERGDPGEMLVKKRTNTLALWNVDISVIGGEIGCGNVSLGPFERSSLKSRSDDNQIADRWLSLVSTLKDPAIVWWGCNAPQPRGYPPTRSMHPWN